MVEKAGYVINNATKLGMITRKSSDPETVFFKEHRDLFPGDKVILSLGDVVYHLRVDVVYFTPPMDTPLGIVFGVDCRVVKYFPRGSHKE